MIMPYLDNVTDVPEEELGEMRRAMEEETVNPMELKKRLARELVTQFQDASSARHAQEHFERTVQGRETPEAIEEVPLWKSEIKLIGGFLYDEMLKGYDLNIVSGIFQEDSPELGIQAGDIVVDVPDLLVKLGLADSVREGRTLLEQGSIAIDGRRLGPYPPGSRTPANVRDASVIQRGSRRFKRLRFRD